MTLFPLIPLIRDLCLVRATGSECIATTLYHQADSERSMLFIQPINKPHAAGEAELIQSHGAAIQFDLWPWIYFSS